MVVEIRSYTPTLKPTRFRCPKCNYTLKELVPDEWYNCERCDLQYDREYLVKKKKDND